jgi:hypothetical protein
MNRRLSSYRWPQLVAYRNAVQLVAGAVVTLLLAGQAEAASYYVNNALSGNGDGRSWSTAWRSLGQIDWRVIRPGDTVFISGGASGRTYAETLTVGASGSSGQPIVIRPGADSGHAGKVTIDAQNTRSNGVIVNGRNHVVVRDLAIRNVADSGVRVRSASAGVVIEGMTVDAGNPNHTGNARGYDVRNSTGVVVRNNSYTTPTSSRSQNDGIYSSGNDSVRFENNRLVISNGYTGSGQGHNDCFQSYLDRNIEVIGNYCEQRNTKTGHSLGIFVQNISGTAQVRNNVVVSPNTNSSCIVVENLAGFSTSGRMLAYNNSAYGCAYGTLFIGRSPGTIARNNILVSPKANANALKIVRPEPPVANLDHNLLFTPGSTRPVTLDGVGLQTWAQWRSRGYEQNGLNVDPAFVDPARGDLKLRAGSPAIDKGTAVSGVTTDTEGTSRPQGGGYDMGAYEHRSGTVGTASQTSGTTVPPTGSTTASASPAPTTATKSQETAEPASATVSKQTKSRKPPSSKRSPPRR